MEIIFYLYQRLGELCCCFINAICCGLRVLLATCDVEEESGPQVEKSGRQLDIGVTEFSMSRHRWFLKIV
jgi:hypothetical protein